MDAREIKLWMTLLGLYRVLGFEGSVSFDTITKPGKIVTGDTIVGFQRFLHDHFYQMASGVYGLTSMLSQAISRNRKGRIPLWTDFAKTLLAEQFVIGKSSPTAGAKEHSASISTAQYGLIDAAVR